MDQPLARGGVDVADKFMRESRAAKKAVPAQALRKATRLGAALGFTHRRSRTA